MGIKGLDSFIDKSHRQAQHYLSSPQLMTDLPLNEIKFVVDGNQLPHQICHEMNCVNNFYGGNYDQVYSKTKEILLALKPFIATIIFEGSKEDPDKAYKRFEKKNDIIANLSTEENPNIPPFFARMILFKLIDELGISYSMTEGMACHAIACYANGENKHGLKYTVLSRNSYFYAYDLEKGYLSFLYLIGLLKEPNNLNGNTKVPIFNMRTLLNYFGFNNHKTWLYFCILMGSDSDNHNERIDKNINYFRAKRIDTRNWNWGNLINHLKRNEFYLMRNNFEEIRSTYDRLTLSRVNILLSQLEFEHKSCKLVPNKTNDFDRFVMSIKDINICFLNSMVSFWIFGFLYLNLYIFWYLF